MTAGKWSTHRRIAEIVKQCLQEGKAVEIDGLAPVVQERGGHQRGDEDGRRVTERAGRGRLSVICVTTLRTRIAPMRRLLRWR